MLYFSCTTPTHVHTCMGAWKEYRESISLTCITYYKLCCLVCKTFRSVLNDICLMNDQIASQFCMCVCLSFSVAVCLFSLCLSHTLSSLSSPTLLCLYVCMRLKFGFWYKLPTVHLTAALLSFSS